MSSHYDGQGLKPVAFDFAAEARTGGRDSVSWSGVEVLGIIQAAFADLGMQNADLIAVKREVLELVAEGQFAHAVRAAIVGAGRACSNG